MLLLMMLVLTNVVHMYRYQQLENNGPKKIEYKEIEVVKKAMCECEHVSSFHKGNTGTCQALTFYTDEGRVKLSRSIECPCTKYTGPVPLSEYFDDKLRELESVRV